MYLIITIILYTVFSWLYLIQELKNKHKIFILELSFMQKVYLFPVNLILNICFTVYGIWSIILPYLIKIKRLW